jgi:hypothetical protein
MPFFILLYKNLISCLFLLCRRFFFQTLARFGHPKVENLAQDKVFFQIKITQMHINYIHIFVVFHKKKLGKKNTRI